MSSPNYTLEIISHHPQFLNKSLRKYYVEGIETVGAWGDEPFEIIFKNNTWQKVQVKLSVDGTDVLTGKLADTEVNSDMWMVNGYGTLSIKAWPENNNGGAQLVFTSANNSVAVHTHGNLSSRGIIAAAVYVEGHVEPIRLNPYYPIVINNNYPQAPRRLDEYYWGSDTGNSGHLRSKNLENYKSSIVDNTFGGSTWTNTSFDGCITGAAGSTYSSDSISLNSCAPSAHAHHLSKEDMKALASVGAGQYVDQIITYVAGLIKPVFTETVRVKYLWWDDLVSKLREHNVPAPHASGFPGDKPKGINLGKTPRIGNYNQPSFPRAQPSYARV